MALISRWWILCAAWFSCVARFGSCDRHRPDGAQPELFIFNELCAYKDDPGPCKAIKDRFFFNVDTGRCELFEYGGCGGNDNNFETVEECEETCVVSDAKDPCHLAEAPGPCRGLVKRYFFDTKSQQCKHFFYGGCFGNANNFRSLGECKTKCQNPVKATEAPEIQTESLRSGDVPEATGTGELILSQTPVILNETYAETDGILDLGQPPVILNETVTEELKPKKGACLSPIDRGTCNGTEKRFAYNPGTKRCQVFHYSGCGGNENNFLSRKHCVRKCMKRKGAAGKMMIRIRRKNLGNIIHHSG